MKKTLPHEFNKLPAESTLSERLADEIRKKILNEWQAGQRLPTTKKIAEQFNCSINSAHHALAILRREGLIDGRTGRGTYVTGQTSEHHVALIVGLSEGHPHLACYAGRVLTETVATLSRLGISYRTYWDFEGVPRQSHARKDGDDIQSLWNNLAARQVAAVGVIQKPRACADNLRLTECGVPVVWNTRMTGGYWVANDFEGMLREGVGSLVAEGATKIAVLTWDEDRRIAEGIHPWATLLKQLFFEYGLEWRPEWLRGSLEPSESGAGYEEFREVWAAFPDKPDGLFVCDDVLLPDAILAIQELGIKVPGDLKVVASANREWGSSWRFPATRIVADPVAYAQAMGNMLATLSQKEEPASRNVIISYTKVMPQMDEDGSAASWALGNIQKIGAPVMDQIHSQPQQ